jgi:hypothetical protein
MGSYKGVTPAFPELFLFNCSVLAQAEHYSIPLPTSHHGRKRSPGTQAQRRTSRRHAFLDRDRPESLFWAGQFDYADVPGPSSIVSSWQITRPPKLKRPFKIHVIRKSTGHRI